MAHATASHVSPEMQQCIDECMRCHALCTRTASHCLELGGKHAEPAHVRLLLDCAQICQTGADFMLRGSERHPLTCRVCADVCRACADECERMTGNDEMIRECAAECRRCQQSCERMAA